MRQTVLVTGATGFLGARLMRRLKATDMSLVGLRRPPAAAASDAAIKWIETRTPASIVEQVKDLNPDVVFHLAALSVHTHSSLQVPELLEANIGLGTYVLEGLRQAKSGRTGDRACFISAGSFWQYSEGSLSFAPNSFYAATKQAFFDICAYYRDMEDIGAMALILPDIYGEGDPRDRILTRLAKTASSAPAIRLSGGEQIVDFMHVDDVVAGFLHAADVLRRPQSALLPEYFLHGISPMRLRDVVARLDAIRGYPLPVSWGALPYRRREVMTPAAGAQLPGWTAKIGLDEGLRRMIADIG